MSANHFRGLRGRSSWLSLTTCFTALALLAACGSDDENEDDAGARQLLARVRGEAYREWTRPPGWESRKPSNAPHGAEVDIYVNDTVADILARGDSVGSLAEGSTIVKDGWNGGQLELIAIMDKRSDGWYWAEYDRNGEPTYSGHPATCTNCHSSGSDFVRAFDLP
jgi:hypothetical protein